MTTNHPANGPVSLERLHQIREILSKASAQSDGGNIGYAMADAVKVIDGEIASSSMEPYGYVHKGIYESCGTSGLSNDHEAYCNSNTHIALYSAPPAPVVPDDLLNMAASAIEDLLEHTDPSTNYYSGVLADVPGKLRAAILQAGNSPVTPDGWIPVSERMPDETQPVIVVSDGGVVQRTVYQFCEGVWVDWYEQYDEVDPDAFTHWMPLPAAPQQEVNS
ncbi:DUF551 domain-containing protein [Citrobacter freundii]|nr:DUF551 domain-containing protein [Citrobacter freundii]